MADVNFLRRSVLKGASASLILPFLNGCGGSDQSAGFIDRDIPAQPPIQPGLSVQPRGIHLSFAGDPLRSRAVTWFTDGLANPGTVVEFGPVLPGMSPAAVQAEPMPRRSEGYVEQAFDIDVLTHRAFMEGVDPDHPLRYRVGHEGAWSEVFVVKAAPSGERFRFSHAADMGTTAAAGWVTQGLVRNDADFFLLPGDLSYADGFQPEWDVWFDRMQSLTARVPMMATPGNHERNDGNGDGYLSRTTHMEPRGARGWYSFTFKNVHFACSSGASFAADGLIDVELGFLEADLASAAARRARGEIDFIVFANHFPLWTDQQGRSPNSPRIIELFEDMLLRYGIDLVLVGHDHIYQRSHRKARGVRDDAGYIQVIAGNGGKSMRNFDPISDWSASAEQRYGYTEYVVEGQRIVASTYAVDVRLGIGDLATNLPAQRERLLDQFEVTPRPMLARRQFVLPARNVGQMLADARIESLRLLQADTRMRNEVHLRRSLESLITG